jgi:hypothetical protein
MAAMYYCVAGYRTTLKLRSVTVSVVVAAIWPWKASTMGNESESYAFRTLGARPSTVPQLYTDNWHADVFAPAWAHPETNASVTAPLRLAITVLPQLTANVKPVSEPSCE